MKKIVLFIHWEWENVAVRRILSCIVDRIDFFNFIMLLYLKNII
jgi:hypothetical protein